MGTELKPSLYGWYLAADDFAPGGLEVLGPGGGGRFEALLGFVQLVEHPLRLVVEFGFALGQRFSRFARGDLGFAEGGAQLDRALVLRDGDLEDARTGVATGAVVTAAAATLALAAAGVALRAASLRAAASLGAAVAGRGRVARRAIGGAGRALGAAATTTGRRAGRGAGGRALAVASAATVVLAGRAGVGLRGGLAFGSRLRRLLIGWLVGAATASAAAAPGPFRWFVHALSLSVWGGGCYLGEQRPPAEDRQGSTENTEGTE